MKTQFLTDNGLKIYDQEMKRYIATKVGVTIEESEINGNLKIDGVETVIYTPTEYYVEY